jgi:hypothetical protein
MYSLSRGTVVEASQMAKLVSTMRICATLAMVRTFGRYEHSGWNGEFEYARYSWRGKTWAFPTSPIRPYKID